ncbi:hypothetical protein D3Z50_13655 [Clostridiaceae bacterium]|nr:hypothetical protein [Clostridiaceae bacterium]
MPIFYFFINICIDFFVPYMLFSLQYEREYIMLISMARKNKLLKEERVKNKVYFWTHLYKGS